MGDLDPSKISKEEDLLKPGEKEGQVKLVNVSDGVEAYQVSVYRLTYSGAIQIKNG